MRKVNNLKWFALGIVVCLSLTTLIVPAFASTISKTAQLAFNDIKIKLNGNELNPKDVNGNTVEPFIIDGTTYLPVRSVSNSLGLDVDWDASTNTVLLKGTTDNEVINVSKDQINAMMLYKDLSDVSLEMIEYCQLLSGYGAQSIVSSNTTIYDSTFEKQYRDLDSCILQIEDSIDNTYNYASNTEGTSTYE